MDQAIGQNVPVTRGSIADHADGDRAKTAAARIIPVVVVLPPRTLLLDVAGPLEVLRRANLIQDAVRFDVRYVGATRSLRTSIGLTLSALAPLPRSLPANAMVVVAGNVDTLLDGTGANESDAAHDAGLVAWLRAKVRPEQRLVTICSGALSPRARGCSTATRARRTISAAPSSPRSRRRHACSTIVSTSRTATG
jgi:hypothetical protein